MDVDIKMLKINLPVQDFPSPENPLTHWQWNEPSVFWQLAFGSQTGMEELHSSTSTKKSKSQQWSSDWWLLLLVTLKGNTGRSDKRPVQYRRCYFSTYGRTLLHRNTFRERVFKFVGTTPFKTFNAKVKCMSEILRLYLITDSILKTIYTFIKLQVFW